MPRTENRKENWKLFLEYAKAHPNEIPKSSSDRANLYHKLMGQCTCGGTHKLCPIVHIDRVTMPSSIKDDPAVLRAEIKTLKQEIRRLKKN